MQPLTWEPGSPATRIAEEEEIVGHLAWPRDWDEAPANGNRRALEGLERLVRLGLPFRIENGARRFDPYEVFYFMRWAHHRHDDPLWAEAVDIARGYPAEYRLREGMDVEFELLFEREIELRGPPFHTHFPLPADDSHQQITVIDPLKGTACSSQTVGHVLDVQASGSPVSFGVRVGCKVRWRGERIDAARVDPFRELEPSDKRYVNECEGPIRVTKQIRQLSSELARDSQTPWDAIQRFWRFLFSRLVFGRIHPHLLSAQDPLWSVIESGRSDCYFGSALLAGLCRARGIPARLVSGYFLYRRFQANHWWVEALVPPYGWVPCDLWTWIPADGNPDSDWGDLFLGRLDPRLVIERFPRSHIVLEPRSARPTYTLQRVSGEGVEIIVRDLERSTQVYLDRVSFLRRSFPDAARGKDSTRST